MRTVCKTFWVAALGVSFSIFLAGCNSSDSSGGATVPGSTPPAPGSQASSAQYYGVRDYNTADTTDRMRSEFRNNW